MNAMTMTCWLALALCGIMRAPGDNYVSIDVPEHKATGSYVHGVDADGDRIAVSLPAGVAIYRYLDSKLGLDSVVSISGLGEGDLVALDVALSSNTCFIAVPRDSSVIHHAGSVRVATCGRDSKWKLGQILVAPDAQLEQRFGSSVVSHGTWCAVGAPGDDEAAIDAGAVYMFHHEDDGWTFVQKIMLPDAVANQAFGLSRVAISDKFMAAAGDHEYNGRAPDSPPAPVFVYALKGDNWKVQSKLVPISPHVTTGIFSYYSIDISADALVVGGYFHSRAQQSVVSVFHLDDDGSWKLEDVLNGDPMHSSAFGCNVETGGHTLVCCAPMFASGESGFYVFDRRDGAWKRRCSVSAPEDVGLFDLSLSDTAAFVALVPHSCDQHPRSRCKLYVCDLAAIGQQEQMKAPVPGHLTEEIVNTLNLEQAHALLKQVTALRLQLGTDTALGKQLKSEFNWLIQRIGKLNGRGG